MNRSFTRGAAFVWLVAVACSGGKSATCVAGASTPCACSNGLTGAQLCASDGSDYGACSCQAGAEGGADGGPTAADGGTPIGWADAWVAGFYGTGFQGLNVYAGLDVAGAPNGYYVEWRGDPGISLYASVNDCSSFSDVLMTRAYGWIPPTSNPRPLAEDYYWAIRNGTRFTEITDVNDIEPGDVIALRYPPSDAFTGHVAWVDAPPSAFSGPPNEPGLSAYAVTVVDSSNDFHDGANGPTTSADDRYLGLLSDGSECATDLQCLDIYGQNAACNSTELTQVVDGGTVPYSVCAYSGVGRGQMRLFADSTGTIQGYSWSPDAYSTFFPRPNPLPGQGDAFPSNDIVVGRYVGQ